MTKDFGLFVFVLSSVTNLKESFLGVEKVFWILLWKLIDHVFNPWEGVQDTNFWKMNIPSFQWKKYIGPTFSPIFEQNKRKEQNMNVQEYFYNFCESYESISVESKK